MKAQKNDKNQLSAIFCQKASGATGMVPKTFYTDFLFIFFSKLGIYSWELNFCQKEKKNDTF